MKNTVTVTLTREQFEAGRVKMAAQGVALNSDEGDSSGHKVDVHFKYIPNVLTITVTHKPLMYPEAMVEKQILDWFTEV